MTSGAANATEAFSSGAQMLKKTVEENTILGDFNRQQEKFMEDQKETNAAQVSAMLWDVLNPSPSLTCRAPSKARLP